MTFSYDVTSDIGLVRLLVPDRDGANPVFQDAEITALLGLEGNIYRAAAAALETAGSDLALTLRITRQLGIEVDGTAASREVRQRAARLREQADYLDAQSGGLFDWAEMVYPHDPFAARERIEAELLRSGL